MKTRRWIIIVGLLLLAVCEPIDTFGQGDPGKEKVLDRSKHFPGWAKGGYSRGKVFKQKKGSKNTKIGCDRGERAYWFINTYETRENLKTKTGGNYYLSLDKAQRFARADLSAKFAELISSEVNTSVFEGVSIEDEIASNIQQIQNDLKATVSVSNLLIVGEAWERVQRYDATFWKIHAWSTICKSNYEALIKRAIQKSVPNISDEDLNKITENLENKIEESEIEEINQ